jgi:ABC-type glycerol-3-phosphate transport system permease component
MTDSTTSADEIDQLILAGRGNLEKTKTQLDAYTKKQKDVDRSFISQIIVRSFVVLIAIIVIAAVAGTYSFGWEKINELSKFLLTILSSVMLPVVTLVLGYYFGKDS